MIRFVSILLDNSAEMPSRGDTALLVFELVSGVDFTIERYTSTVLETDVTVFGRMSAPLTEKIFGDFRLASEGIVICDSLIDRRACEKIRFNLFNSTNTPYEIKSEQTLGKIVFKADSEMQLIDMTPEIDEF